MKNAHRVIDAVQTENNVLKISNDVFSNNLAAQLVVK